MLVNILQKLCAKKPRAVDDRSPPKPAFTPWSVGVQRGYDGKYYIVEYRPLYEWGVALGYAWVTLGDSNTITGVNKFDTMADAKAAIQIYVDTNNHQTEVVYTPKQVDSETARVDA